MTEERRRRGKKRVGFYFHFVLLREMSCCAAQKKEKGGHLFQVVAGHTVFFFAMPIVAQKYSCGEERRKGIGKKMRRFFGWCHM